MFLIFKKLEYNCFKVTMYFKKTVGVNLEIGFLTVCPALNSFSWTYSRTFVDHECFTLTSGRPGEC